MQQWNSGYGPVLNKLFVIPLQIIDVMFSAIVPIYNVIVWVGKVIISNVFMDSLILNIPNVKDFGIGLSNLTRHVGTEIPTYLQALAIPCNYARQGDFCYEAGNNRVFDLITAMGHVRSMAAAISRIGMGLCLSATAPINIVMFPFMDINLAKGVHNIVNSVLYTLFQLPSVTVQRCRNHGG